MQKNDMPVLEILSMIQYKLKKKIDSLRECEFFETDEFLSGMYCAFDMITDEIRTQIKLLLPYDENKNKEILMKQFEYINRELNANAKD